MTSKPKYKHDCDTCIFLGHYTTDKHPDHKELVCDVWFCPRCDDGTLICRRSSRGDDYASCPSGVFSQAAPRQPWLCHAASLLMKHLYNQAMNKKAD